MLLEQSIIAPLSIGKGKYYRELSEAIVTVPIL
jgi:hypothetical protein